MIAQATPLTIYPKQRAFVESTATTTGFVAGRGSGKTRIGADKFLMRMRRDRLYVMVAPTYIVMRDATWRMFRERAQAMQLWLGENLSERTARIRTFDGGVAQVVARTGEKPELLRGPNLSGAWIDEASVTREEVFMNLFPCLREGGQMGWLQLTFTPKGRRHWTFSQFYHPDSPTDALKPRDNTWLIHAHTRENPFIHPEFYRQTRAKMTTAVAEQELAGMFVELGGVMVRREYFGSIEWQQLPPYYEMKYLRYWDKAATPLDEDAGSAYTAGVLIGYHEPVDKYYILDVERGQWTHFRRNRIMKQTAAEDRERYGNVMIYFEQEPGSGGKESALETRKLLQEYAVLADRPSGRQHRLIAGERLPGAAKVERFAPFAAAVEGGRISVVNAKWTDDYLDELCTFPHSRFADQVDATSGGYNKLAGRSAKVGTPEAIEHPRQEGGAARFHIPAAPRRARRSSILGASGRSGR